MNLIIDVGNSFIKMAVFQEDKLLKKEILLKNKFSEKFEKLEHFALKFDNVIVSDVANSIAARLKKIEKKYPVFHLSPELKLPFNNKYATPETLGKDRIALIAAASKYYQNKNVLVIDVGTCLTFDFLNSENEFLGGAISPGLKMRYAALHNFTAKLPLLEPVEDAALLGDTTKSSMHSGVINGMIKEIDGVIADYSAKYQELTVILTGGDMQFLSKRLKSSIFAHSNFLLEGLNYILEINI